jgi:hypothetical protein
LVTYPLDRGFFRGILYSQEGVVKLSLSLAGSSLARESGKSSNRLTKYQRVRQLALELDAVDATGSGVTRKFEEV